jgi:hypothetical protein
MPDLVLDPEQPKLVAPGVPFRVRGAAGREVGVLTPTAQPDDAPLSITPEEVDELSRRVADDRRDWPATQEVLARLEARAAS